MHATAASERTPATDTATGRRGHRPGAARADRPWAVAALLTVFAGSIIVTTVRNPQGVVISSDPGYPPVAVPLLLVPAALAVTLTLLLPRGKGASAVAVRHPGAAWWETTGLIVLGVSFLLLAPLLPLPEDTVLLKAAMFIIVPCVMLWLLARLRGPAVDIARPHIPWWIVLIPVLTMGALSAIGPFSLGSPSSWPPLATLIIAATATAITAGLGEELLLRRFLQTRLEALAGPWTGILVASVLFGLLHAFSHGSGSLAGNAIQAVAMQGTTGIALGVIWSRWRRIWACVLAHMLLNGLGVLLHLLQLLGTLG